MNSRKESQFATTDPKKGTSIHTLTFKNGFYLQCVAVGFQEAIVRTDSTQCIISMFYDLSRIEMECINYAKTDQLSTF